MLDTKLYAPFPSPSTSLHPLLIPGGFIRSKGSDSLGLALLACAFLPTPLSLTHVTPLPNTVPSQPQLVNITGPPTPLSAPIWPPFLIPHPFPPSNEEGTQNLVPNLLNLLLIFLVISHHPLCGPMPSSLLFLCHPLLYKGAHPIVPLTFLFCFVNPEFCIWQKYPKSEIKAFSNQGELREFVANKLGVAFFCFVLFVLYY